MLSTLAKQFVTNGLLNMTTSRARFNGGIGVGFFAMATGIGIIGMVFMAVAVYGVLLVDFSMPAAAALTGIGTLTLSLLCVIAGKYAMSRMSDKRYNEERHQIDALVGQLMDEVLGDFEDPIRENPKTALLLASLAGFVAGDRMH